MIWVLDPMAARRALSARLLHCPAAASAGRQPRRMRTAAAAPPAGGDDYLLEVVTAALLPPGTLTPGTPRTRGRPTIQR